RPEIEDLDAVGGKITAVAGANRIAVLGRPAGDLLDRRGGMTDQRVRPVTGKARRTGHELRLPASFRFTRRTQRLDDFCRGPVDRLRRQRAPIDAYATVALHHVRGLSAVELAGIDGRA